MWSKNLLFFSLMLPAVSAVATPQPVIENRANAINGEFTMNFSGRIFRPACQFNQGQPIDVDFETVGIKRIDGVRYAKTTVIKMSCVAGEGQQLKLQLQGMPYGGQTGILKTDTNNLGISLKEAISGQPIVLNVFFNVMEKTEFVFIATPVREDNNQDLVAGHFSATATLVSSYF